MAEFEIKTGDALQRLAEIESESVQTCVTSPPYFGLRDYGIAEQIGLEETPEAYVSKLVDVFRGARRVLRNDGTLWLNLGDTYAASGMGGNPEESAFRKQATNAGSLIAGRKAPPGLKPKDLIGIPWMVAFALRSDGWYLRSDIIWNKTNGMVESVKDRPTKSHEYIFLLSKSPRYFYDALAISEEIKGESFERALRAVSPQHKNLSVPGQQQHSMHKARANGEGYRLPERKNKRSVWTVSTCGFSEAHFATFPPELIKPCILAGSKEMGLVLDPFCGAGTTGLVALRHNRNFIGIELNPDYVAMARRRILNDAPLLNREKAA